MVWSNAFDLGACTVEVWRAGTNYFSGAMSKGSTSATFNGYNGATEPLRVNVSASGVVSLINSDPSNFGSGSDGYDVRVIPSYPVAGIAARASSITITGDAVYLAYASPDSTGINNVVLTPLNPSLWVATGVTPDPAMVGSGVSYIAVNQGAGV